MMVIRLLDLHIICRTLIASFIRRDGDGDGDDDDDNDGNRNNHSYIHTSYTSHTSHINHISHNKNNNNKTTKQQPPQSTTTGTTTTTSCTCKIPYITGCSCMMKGAYAYAHATCNMHMQQGTRCICRRPALPPSPLFASLRQTVCTYVCRSRELTKPNPIQPTRGRGTEDLTVRARDLSKEVVLYRLLEGRSGSIYASSELLIV